LILTGRGVTAKEAKEMGLANRVVPDGQVIFNNQLNEFFIFIFVSSLWQHKL
jgi:enoyl-CoA hydratase/carnithine racemase